MQTGIADENSQQSSQVFMFPVPADLFLQVETNLDPDFPTFISVYDFSGKQVLLKKSHLQSSRINTSAFLNGIYLLQILLLNYWI